MKANSDNNCNCNYKHTYIPVIGGPTNTDATLTVALLMRLRDRDVHNIMTKKRTPRTLPGWLRRNRKRTRMGRAITAITDIISNSIR